MQLHHQRARSSVFASRSTRPSFYRNKMLTKCPLSAHQLCKVRSSAVGGDGKGYSLAMVKRVLAKKIIISVLDLETSKFLPAVQVDHGTLCALKASTRKKELLKIVRSPRLLPEEMAEAGERQPNGVEATVPEITLEPNTVMQPGISKNLYVTKYFKTGTTLLAISEGSIVDFTGDAIVNAANAGCLGGGGIDGAINRAGGQEVLDARLALPAVSNTLPEVRCYVGDATVTCAGKLPCKYIIHAVGPHFGCYDNLVEPLEVLKKSFKSSLARACERGIKTVAFCLISGGIFRADCPLAVIIKAALYAIASNAYPGLETVYLCGYTDMERTVMDLVTNHSAADGLLHIADPSFTAREGMHDDEFDRYLQATPRPHV